MSDTESHQAYIDASEASIPAENGPREVANDPPPLGSAEERENDPGRRPRGAQPRHGAPTGTSFVFPSPPVRSRVFANFSIPFLRPKIQSWID